MKIKENNKKNYLNQQGITLIALVITIIVLLILAAVTISTVFGENGLLKSIEIAREKTEIAEYKEDLNQKLLEAKMNVLLDNSKVLEETRKIILRDKKYDGAVVSKVEDNKFTVITKEGYKFEVTPDGAEYLEKTSGTIEENKGSIVMTAAVEGEKANITFELKTEKTKEQWATEWIEKYTVDKSESDLEGEIVKAYNEKNSTTYEDFDKYLTATNKTREDLKKEADEAGFSYKAYLFVQKIVCSEDMGSLMEMYFAYALDLSETETDYNKQLEIINDTDKLKASMLRILEYNSFEQLLEENEITEEEFEETMNKLKQQINLTDNQALCYITILLYEPITVNVSNGDSFKVNFTDIMDSIPYEYTPSTGGTLTLNATGPQGMAGTIDIEFATRNLIPVGGTYTKAETGEVLVGNGTTVCFPESPTKLDKYTYQDYEYRYKDLFVWGVWVSENEGLKDAVTIPEDCMWVAHVADNTKTEYAKMLDDVNGVDVNYLTDAFYDCKNMTKAPVISANAINIGVMFEGCSSLKDISNITITDKITEISGLFSDCTSLTETDLANFIIPDRMTNINELFSGCSSIVDASNIHIPTMVTSMARLFENCSSLTKYPDFSNCTQNNITICEAFVNCTSLTNFNGLVIPSGVNNMLGTFYGCTGLTTLQGLSIPENVDILGNNFLSHGCFEGCTNLTDASNITISIKITNMDQIFKDCTNLSKAPIIQNTVTNFGSCFENTPKLTEITFNGTKAQWESIVDSGALTGKTIHCTDGDI